MLKNWDHNYWLNIGMVVATRMLLVDELEREYSPATIKNILKNCPTAFDNEFYQEAGNATSDLFDDISNQEENAFEAVDRYENLRERICALIKKIDSALPVEVTKNYNFIY